MLMLLLVDVFFVFVDSLDKIFFEFVLLGLFEVYDVVVVCFQTRG